MHFHKQVCETEGKVGQQAPPCLEYARWLQFGNPYAKSSEAVDFNASLKHLFVTGRDPELTTKYPFKLLTLRCGYT